MSLDAFGHRGCRVDGFARFGPGFVGPVGQPTQQCADIDAGQVATELEPGRYVGGHRFGQRGRTVGRDHGHLVDRADRRRGSLHHLGQDLDDQVQHGGFAVPFECLGFGLHGLSLGAATGLDRGGLGGALPLDSFRERGPPALLGDGLTFDRLGDRAASTVLGLTVLGALDRVRVRERGATGALAVTIQAGLLGAGLRGGDGGLPVGVGAQDRCVAGGLSFLLHLVPGCVGRFADLSIELTLLQLGVALRDQLLLAQDGLLLPGLGKRPGGGGPGVGSVDFGTDGRLLERQVPLPRRSLPPL